MKKKIPPLICVCALIIAGLFYMLSFVLQDGRGALVVTFGNPSGSLVAPGDAGLHFRWPWPVQKVYIYDMRERIFTGSLQEVSDSEGTLVVVGAFVSWRVIDPKRFHLDIGGDAASAEELLSASLSNGLNQVFGRNSYSKLVQFDSKSVAGNGPLELQKLEKELSENLKGILSQYGIGVSEVGIHRLMLPPSASKGVFDQMRNAKELDAKNIEAQGEALASNIKAKVNRDYELELAKARTEADRIISDARSKAAGILAAVKNKDLLIFLDKLETFKEFLSGQTTWVVDTRTMPLDLIDEIKGLGKKAEKEIKSIQPGKSKMEIKSMPPGKPKMEIKSIQPGKSKMELKETSQSQVPLETGPGGGDRK